MIEIKDLFIKNTKSYEEEFKHKDKNKIGQFITDWNISNFMGSLANPRDTNVKILDPGAGTGMLTLGYCYNLDFSTVNNVHVDLIENDLDIIPTLKKNMEILEIYLKNKNIVFTYSILELDFIESNKENWNKEELLREEQYDIVIANPPYFKIRKNNASAEIMEDIVYGQPNIYYLFMAMSIHLLRNSGEAIFIIPRSFTNGVYFKKFRIWLLNNSYITYIHLFESRTKTFKENNILQELVIIRLEKKFVEDTVISTSDDSTFADIKTFSINYNSLICSKNDNKFIRIPSTEKEIEILKLFAKLKNSLLDFKLKFSTGKVVPFRAKKLINNSNKNQTVLIKAKNLDGDILDFNSLKSPTIEVSDKTKNILNETSNILLIKRTSSKEDTKRLNLSIILEEECDHNYIGIENHINYLNGSSDLNIIYGLYALFSSSYYDNYIRITSGSTQINATDLNNLPLPELKTIKKIGNEYRKNNKNFDYLAEKYVFEISKEDLNETKNKRSYRYTEPIGFTKTATE